MAGKLFALVGLWLFSAVTYAVSNQEILNNLRSRIVSLNGDRALIRSFDTHTQSYIYDQALAIIAFSKAGEQKTAKRLLKGLSALQLKDGSLYFSYNLDGTSPYPAEGDRRYAGAISWVALAATHYQSQFKNQEFVSFNLKLLQWLRSEIKPLTISGTYHEALRFGPSDVAESPWSEKETVALEHNLDAFSAYTHFAQLNPDYEWKMEIASIRKFIMAMWDKKRSHFWSGANLVTGKINKEELYLDNQTWSLLALDFESLKEIDAHSALALNCEMLYVEHEGISGFIDSKPTNGPGKYEFVWSEGTLGQVMAMEKAGFECGPKKAKELISSVQKMKRADGGIGYATTTTNPDFTTSSSVAGTAWMYFASNSINPFSLEVLPKKLHPLLAHSGR
ncbi:MAG: hypothetical protein V4598_12095 [Bdellovibrionota bacterium]